MIVTLLSDIGSNELSLAITKGALLKAVPGVTLIDLNHEIAPYGLHQSMYHLKGAIPFFPEHTIHIALIDLFPKKSAKILLGQINNSFIISSDNGLLPLVLENNNENIFEIGTTNVDFENWLQVVTGFLAEWETDNFSTTHLKSTEAQTLSETFEPQITEDSIKCNVIHVDRYGNVVLNLHKGIFEKIRNNRKFRISFSLTEEIRTISNHYTDVPIGQKLCLFNSAGFLEIAVNNGQASKLFALSLTKKVQFSYSFISVDFFD